MTHKDYSNQSLTGMIAALICLLCLTQLLFVGVVLFTINTELLPIARGTRAEVERIEKSLNTDREDVLSMDAWEEPVKANDPQSHE